MLTLVVPPVEMWDEKTEQFSYSDSGTLVMEHSLIAISKWEAKYKKPFFNGKGEALTYEELQDYICFALVDGDPKLAPFLSEENYIQIKDYLEDAQTASTVKQKEQKHSGPGGQFLSSELIYSYMVGLRIPWEAQYWNVNRLLMLIRICNEQNQPKEKMPKKTNVSRMAALNKARRAKLGSSG